MKWNVFANNLTKQYLLNLYKPLVETFAKVHVQQRATLYKAIYFLGNRIKLYSILYGLFIV